MASNSSNPNDWAEANKKFFNEHAAGYDNLAAGTTLMETIGEEVIGNKGWSGVAWDEGGTRALDYACGTGLISRILAPYTKQLIGMDISEGMVEQFNKTVDNQGIPFDEMRAVVADLCADEVNPALADLIYYNFDVAISTMAFHHLGNVPLAIKRITERLKPETGVLLVVDFRTHEPIHPNYHHVQEGQHGHHHQHSHHHQHGHKAPRDTSLDFRAGAHTVSHSGFSEDDFRRWYTEAGLVDIEIVDVGPGTGITMTGMTSATGEPLVMKRAIFMAKGRRA